MKSVNLALRYKPNYADAFAQRASLLVESGDSDLAVLEYFNAIKAATYRMDRFHVPFGKIYLKQEQYGKALKHFSKANAINATNLIAWKNEFYI